MHHCDVHCDPGDPHSIFPHRVWSAVCSTGALKIEGQSTVNRRVKTWDAGALDGRVLPWPPGSLVDPERFQEVERE